MDKKLYIGAAALGSLWASPAMAQPVQEDTGRAEVIILIPLQITNIDDLEFGTVVADPLLAGTVHIPADGSPRSFSGGVQGVASDPGARAVVATAGAPGQQVLVAYAPPAALNDGFGNSITVLGMSMEGSPLKTIDPITRSLFINFGGTLLIAPNQAEGNYEANFEVIIDYL